MYQNPSLEPFTVGQQESNTYLISANGQSILSDVPSYELAEKVICAIKDSPINVNWATFDGQMWLPVQISLEQAITEVKTHEKLD